MAKGRLSIYVNTDFLNDFSKTLTLTIEQIQFFTEHFRKEESFEFKTEDVEKFVDQFNFDPNNLAPISSVVKFILKYCIENNYTEEDIASELEQLATKVSKKLGKGKLNAFLDLFKISEDTFDKLSTSPYLNSIIPLLTSSTALFDLRTVFESDSDNIKTLKPVAIVRLEAIDDKENKQYFRFQIELESLKKIISFFEGYRNRLEKLDEINEKVSL
ncbi:MAG: hypothetical protein ABJ004_16760 [Cyclobacteriaceae bacterium]